MRILVDVTEPGSYLQTLRVQAEAAGISVESTILHKRPGSGAALRADHPRYGGGADYVILDAVGLPVAAVERKTLEDLARSLTIGQGDDGPRLFRQMKDLTAHPSPILLLEGTPSLLYRRAERAILGFQFWCAREGIAILHASNAQAAASAVVLVAKKLASIRAEGVVPDGPQGPWDPAA